MEYDEIALIQLHTAIDLYFAENYICAITLAGAAEEISGKLLLHSKNEKPFLEELYEKNKTIIPIVKKEMVRHFNNTRDLLKHFDANRKLHEFKPVDDAVFMIGRAIANYINLMGVKTEKIENFLNDKIASQVIESYR